MTRNDEHMLKLFTSYIKKASTEQLQILAKHINHELIHPDRVVVMKVCPKDCENTTIFPESSL